MDDPFCHRTPDMQSTMGHGMDFTYGEILLSRDICFVNTLGLTTTSTLLHTAVALFNPAVMSSSLTLRALFVGLLLFISTPQVLSQSSSSAVPPAPVASSSATLTPSPVAPSTAPSQTTSLQSSPAVPSIATPPDVLLNVPNLSVGRIELVVENLVADINLNANVASLVNINAGVALSIQKVNLTIVDVQAELELVVRLGNLVEIVNRVFESLDLNPLLINTLNNVTDILDPIVGAVDGLLGSITQGGSVLSFLVDNFGNIVQQVGGTNGGSPVSTIVGNYLSNMTDTGATETLPNGLVQRTYSYSPLNALVNILFNSAGQVVQSTVVKQNGGSSLPVSITSSAGSSTSTAMRPPTTTTSSRRR